ncbi:MAG: SAM-dependent methyltransferase, partial [Bacteroidetes bacterium]
GFGTGLNALLTWLHAGDTPIAYTAIEAYPLAPEQISALNYPQVLTDPQATEAFAQLHQAPWDALTPLRPGFTLLKHATTLEAYQPEGTFDLIYYDAFAPNAQPELWSEAVMARLFTWLDPGGIFITYSAKSSVRRGLIQAGFGVEKLPGPPGKREMLRARRPRSPLESE